MGRRKIILGLIGLFCMGNSLRVEAASTTTVSSAADLTAAGGEVTIDGTDGVVDGPTMGIVNNGSGGDFVYTGDVNINVTGYDLGGSGTERTAIRSTTSDLTLGKTTVIWRNDAANTPSNVYAYGLRTHMGSTVTLGSGSTIDMEGNMSGVMNGIYAGDNATGGPGHVVLGDQTTILVKNSGNGLVYGIDSYDAATISAGDELYINVSGGTGGARGMEVGLDDASLTIGSDATVIANSTGLSMGLYAHRGGQFTAQENLNIQVDSTDTSYGIYSGGKDTTTMTSSRVELNGATVSVRENGVMGGYSLVAMNTGEIHGNLGKYDLTGDMISNNGIIDLNFDKGSSFTGATYISGAGTVDYQMDGTTWNMTDDSTVTSLTFAGDTSNIVFAGDSAYKTLTIGDLAGTGGNFTMRTDLVGDGAGNNAGDFLEVTGTSAGNHTVTVQNNGAANATGDETLTIIRTADGVAKFTNTNVVELGGYEYNLREVAGSNEKEWELFGTKAADPTIPTGPGASKPGSAAVNLFAGSYLLNYAETQTLMKRMGDLRDGKESGNVWGRIYGGKFHSDSDSFLKDFDLKYVGVQVGADKKFIREDGKGVAYLGGFFGYTKGDIDYGYGSGDVDSKSIGAYWTHMHHNGFYADAVLKYGWMKNDFDVLDSQGAKVTGDDISTRGFTGSLEVGRRYHFDQKEKSGWYVEPQAQLTVSQQNGDRFTASNGLNIKVDSFRSVMGRVGTHVGYEVKGGKNPINIYGKVSVVKEFDGDVNYSFNGSPESTSYKDTWVVYGVGATAKLGARHNLYLDVERATGGQFTQSWAINGGYRYSW